MIPNLFPLFSTLLFGCNIGGNSPPRFQTFNGEEVKYLFGIAYLQSATFEGIAVEPETRWNIDIDVSDANGDDIEILFPGAPGVFEFNQENHTGYWDVPAEVPDYFPQLQVLAIDEHGASDVLFLSIEVYQEWDSAGWDTASWDTGWSNIPSYGGPTLTGSMNLENGFVGSMEFQDPRFQCRITWQAVEGQSIESCEWCDRSWQFTLRNGTVETRPESCSDVQTNLESQEWRIGWTENAIWNDLTYEDTVFYEHPTAGWSPMGQGNLEGNRFDFTLQNP